MAMTLEELKSLVSATGLKYFVHPELPMLSLGVSGERSRFQFTVSLQSEGQFLQLRTANLLACPASHAHLPALLLALAAVNYQYRCVKWAWDRNDGEVVAYCDAWIGDGKLTAQQVGAMLALFMQNVDANRPRAEKALETGADPGAIEARPAAAPPSGPPPPGPASPTIEI